MSPYWKFITETAKEVDQWPAWMAGGPRGMTIRAWRRKMQRDRARRRAIRERAI